MTTRERPRHDVEDYLRGMNFMSASGGGDPEVERAHLLADLEAGRELGWQPLSEFEDDDTLFCHLLLRSDRARGVRRPNRGGRGARRQPRCTTRLSPGGAAARASARYDLQRADLDRDGRDQRRRDPRARPRRLGLPLADADFAGRAIPELHATTLDLHDADVLPFALADRWGNETVIVKSPSHAFTERIGKFVAQAALGIVGCAFAAMSARQAADWADPRNADRGARLGQRRSGRPTRDPVTAAAEQLGGWVLFRGTVIGRDWVNNGYMEGAHTLTGEGDFAGHELRVWFRNENHVSWLDGEPWVASPDLIEFCDAETAEPRVNTDLEMGQRARGCRMRRRDAFDSEAGLKVLGPQHFGFDLPFRGIEQLAV